MGQVKCVKCGSDNVFVQQVQTGSKGVTVVKGKKHHSVVYWCTIGWIIALMKFIFWACGGWIIGLFFGHQDGIAGETTTMNTYSTMATCQNCGHTWKL